MVFEKVQLNVREILTEAEHRKVISKRMEDATQLLWEAHIGLVGNKFKENPGLISYEEAREKTEAAMRLLAPLVKSLEDGEKTFDASMAGNKR
jgi:hypothetical protein